jgi:hypothetical protein
MSHVNYRVIGYQGTKKSVDEKPTATYYEKWFMGSKRY